MKKLPTIIGIDGGASKVSAHIIEKNGDTFSLGKYNSIKEYNNYPDYQKDFIPVNLPTQLEQIQNCNIVLTAAEIKQSQSYFDAFSDAISDIIKLTKTENILIGIGMPGVKTTDERGIAAMANGPRMPNFTAEIEQRIDKSGITLIAPIFKIGSDADYCGIGEEYAEKGNFRDIENAYYLGGGTGTADALKLRGKLILLDECKDWISKTWEMSDENGKSMEIYCSANGIQSIYSVFASMSQSELGENKIYSEQILELANKNDNAAITTWQTVSKYLADLIFERISTIYSGWQNNFSFINPNRKKLKSNHFYIGTLLDRIVIGQRLGDTIRMKTAQKIIVKPILNHLSQLIKESKTLDDAAKLHYLKNDTFNSEILTSSELREAPALGAGIDAWQSFNNG